jgi:hypothetical protein
VGVKSMKHYFLLGNLAGLALLLANLSPAFAQSRSQPRRANPTDDTTAILNMVRGWGAVEDILIVNNYAILRYSYGQNGGNVTFRRVQGKWNIIDGGRHQNNCQSINCLVNKGVPRNVATQLFNYLENSPQRQEREIKAFQQAWARTNRSIAPFLGYWKNQGIPESSPLSVSIWPSPVANRVCVVGISAKSQFVKTGTVSGNNLRMDNETLTLFQDNENFGDEISSRDNKYFLINPSKLNTWYFNSATRQQLQNSGCTSSLPK